jgi:hypothetical protein
MIGPLSNRVLTTTNQYIMPKLVDTILNSNVLLTRVLSSAKKWQGERMLFPVKFAKNQTGTSFSGFDTFSIAGQNTRVRMEYYPSFYRIGIALPLDEISVNQGSEEKIIDLIDLEVKSSAQDMADNLGDIFYSDGSGNGGKDPLGLAALVDDGSVASTIGGLSRSTYTTLQSTVTASGGTLSLAKMSTLYNSISSGSVTPSLGITTKAVFALYESLLTSQERIVKEVSTMKYTTSNGLNSGTGLIGGTGFTGLFYKGFPILADEKATSGTLYFLNEQFLDFYAVPMAMTEAIKYGSADIAGNDYNAPLGLGFTWSGWKKTFNQATIVGDVYLGGQFVTTNPKRHGKLTGITAV